MIKKGMQLYLSIAKNGRQLHFSELQKFIDNAIEHGENAIRVEVDGLSIGIEGFKVRKK